MGEDGIGGQYGHWQSGMIVKQVGVIVQESSKIYQDRGMVVLEDGVIVGYGSGVIQESNSIRRVEWSSRKAAKYFERAAWLSGMVV